MDTRKAGRIVAALAALAPQPLWAQASVAQLTQVNGNVLVSREAGMAAGTEAQAIVNGTRIITTANSRVVVVFNNGCRVEMRENQRLDVDNSKPCAALIPQSLAVGAPAVGAPLAGYVGSGLLGLGGLAGGGGGGSTTPVSPN